MIYRDILNYKSTTKSINTKQNTYTAVFVPDRTRSTIPGFSKRESVQVNALNENEAVARANYIVSNRLKLGTIVNLTKHSYVTVIPLGEVDRPLTKVQKDIVYKEYIKDKLIRDAILNEISMSTDSD